MAQVWRLNKDTTMSPLSFTRMRAGMPSVGAISHEAAPDPDTVALTLAVI